MNILLIKWRFATVPKFGYYTIEVYPVLGPIIRRLFHYFATCTPANSTGGKLPRDPCGLSRL